MPFFPGTQYSIAAAVVIAFLVAALLVRLAHAVIHRLLDHLDIVSAENRAAVHARGQQLIRALMLLAYGVAALASVSFALARFGVGEPRWNPRAAAQWLLGHGINVAVIVIGAFIVVRAANLAIVHLQHKLGRHHAQGDLEWQRRAATLGGILANMVSVSVGFVAVLMLLREMAIDIVPILTGAGIAGLAIGFGAQNLVRDVISGFFLILEDQVRVGDLARINGVGGTVEQVNLRTIVLRDGDGAVQVFPNGTITALANLSKQYSYAIVDVRVAYTENIDRVVGTLRDIGESMQRDAVWGALVMGSLQIAAVESIEGGLSTIRARFKALPLNQGKVANELRRRIVPTFVARGIKPYA
jgi:moderate conductance mechanosensitive channel